MSSQPFSSSFASSFNPRSFSARASHDETRTQKPVAAFSSFDFESVTAHICVAVARNGRLTMNSRTSYLNVYPTIGQGATFNVKRSEQQFLHGSHGFVPPNEIIAYKRLRRFPLLSKPERLNQLRSFILELRALTHPSLSGHENIVSLLGFAFEPDFYGNDDVWPVLLLEHADYGTLADLQESRLTLRAQAKLDLCLDVALGLQALHGCGIIHGDVKSENILMFQHSQRGYVAKIGDFGYSIFGEEQGSSIPRGTFPWTAPELVSATRQGAALDLEKADIYSYGFLFFRAMNDGISPFRPQDLSSDLPETGRVNFIEKLKQSTGDNQLLGHLMKFFTYHKEGIRDMNFQMISRIVMTTLQPEPKRRSLTEVLRILVDELRGVGSCHSRQRQESFSIVSSSTQSPPSKLRSIRDDAELVPSDIHYLAVSRFEIGARQELVKSLARLAERAITLDERLKNPASRQIRETAHGPGSCLKLFEFYVKGIGGDRDYKLASRWLIKAAKCGSLEAAGYLQRHHDAMGIDMPWEDSLDMPVTMAAVDGYPGARECIRALKLSTLAKMAPSDKWWTFGIEQHEGLAQYLPGGLNFLDSVLLPRQILRLITEVNSANTPLSALPISQNGDTLLHLVTLFGTDSGVIPTLLANGIPINALNHFGETGLFQACRAGYLGLAKSLLEMGADASISDNVGQNPLHCLCNLQMSFKNMQQLSGQLLKNKANPNGISGPHQPDQSHNRRVSPEADPGSPLHYAVGTNNITAVRVLIEIGAETCLRAGEKGWTPIELASNYHLRDILECLVQNTPGCDFNDYGPHGFNLLGNAIMGDKIYQMARHGHRQKQAMRETLSYVQSYTSRSRVSTYGLTAVYAAVQNGDEDLVRHVLQLGGVDQINRRCEANFSPLEVAIMQSNKPVFKVLLEFGAEVFGKHTPGAGGFNYLHDCASQCNLDLFFAQELLERGLGKLGMAEALILDSVPPVLYTAIVHGNFKLAELLMQKHRHNINSPVTNRSNITIFGQILSEGPDIACLDFLLGLTGGDEPDFHIGSTDSSSILHRLCVTLADPLDAPLTRQIFSRVLERYNKPYQVNCQTKERDLHGLFTPLHAAVEFYNVEAVRALLQAGADVLAKNAQGQTPLDMIREKIAQGDVPKKVYEKGDRAVERLRERWMTIANALQGRTPDLSDELDSFRLEVGQQEGQQHDVDKESKQPASSSSASAEEWSYKADGSVAVDDHSFSIPGDLVEQFKESKQWWAAATRAQLLHVTAEARTNQELGLCAFFYRYLISADEADLPLLPDGRKFPPRTWKILHDHAEREGWSPGYKDVLEKYRREEEDHPAIKELAGKEPEFWEENMFGEREAEKLRRYSPWRREQGSKE